MDRKLRKALIEQGWRVEPTKGGHWRCYAPDGITIVHLAGTPSDKRTWPNELARLRQYGFEWPWPPRK